MSDGSFVNQNDTTGPTTNLVTVTTSTTPTPTTTGATPEGQGAANVAAGLAVSAATHSVSLPGNALNSPQLINVVKGLAATGEIRIGNNNSINLGVGPDGQVTIYGKHLGGAVGAGTPINQYGQPTGEFNGQLVYAPNYAVNNNVSSTLQNSHIYVDPLILDLNGDGVQLTSFADRTVLFDIDHDQNASREQTGWVKADTTTPSPQPSPTGETGAIRMDGIVVHDLDGNGRIDDISETLSEYYGGAIGEKPHANGIAALAGLDTSGDGQFTAADSAWNELRVWVDANADGRTDPGELQTFEGLSITAINLDNAVSQSGLINNGNEILATTSFTLNGETRAAVAASFIANPAGHSFEVSGNGVIDRVAAGDGGAASSSYATSITTGATLDAAALGVNNLYGNDGNDTLTGDANANWLAGGLGADSLNGGAGDDVILFDAQDHIDGGEGNDVAHVVGDAGVVLNLAQSHIEAAIGGRGDDILIGGGRSSVFIEAGDGDDIVIGGGASDVLNGENGDDLLDGGAGNDLIRGHRGQDQLLGGAGDDILEGGRDDDRLSGGAGNDVLRGDEGDDTLDGGEGTDAVKFSGSYAEYRVIRTGEGIYIADTVAGRDGTDFVKNVETLSFRDVGLVDGSRLKGAAVRTTMGAGNDEGWEIAA